MKIKSCLLIPLSLILLAGAPAHAFTPVQHEAVRHLGELNGIALHCGYTFEIHRMKEVLSNTVPKVRQLGEYFEDETQKSFNTMLQKNLSCPGPEKFHERVDGAIGALRAAYPK